MRPSGARDERRESVKLQWLETMRDDAVRYGVAWPRLDMSPWITAMSRVTKHIGFGLTYATTFMHPFYVARLLNSLDHIPNGRIAFNVITSQRKSRRVAVVAVWCDVAAAKRLSTHHAAEPSSWGEGGRPSRAAVRGVNVPVAALFRKQVSRRAVQLPRLVQAWV